MSNPKNENGLTFHALGLQPSITKALDEMGFTHCSPIQEKSLPHSLTGHDVLGKAQTGTGKTAAFLIALFEDLLKNGAPEERYRGEARSLILAPTRELAMQIAADAKQIGKHAGLSIHTLVGGMDFGKQLKQIQGEFVDILVATPGRLLDFCERREIFLDQVEVLVIDEADRMLDMGFIPQIKRIVRLTPKKEHRQTLLFSATFSHDVLRLAEQWMWEPSTIEIESEALTTSTVEQVVYLVESSEKIKLLENLLDEPNVGSIMVFANRRDQCKRLHEALKRKGFSVGILTGDVPQNNRVKTLERFKSGKLQALVATDVAGRGIHIDDVTHVVNFTLPEEAEDYVHRIGRTGRAGSSGISISFACEDDAFLLPNIEEVIGKKLECQQPPEHLLK